MHEPVSVSDGERSVIAELFSSPEVGARRVELAAGTTLFDAAQAAQNAWLIVQGQVRTYQAGPDGFDRLTDILGPQDWLGAAALGQLAHYFSHAVATVPSVVLEVSGQRLLEVLSRRPEVAAMFIRHLVRKVYQAREEADRLVFDDCHRRLLKTLVRFSQSSAAMPQGEGVVLRITHYQLAQAVGVARETISLALTQLRHQNLLRTGRNQLFFNPQDLLRLVEQGRDDSANSAYGDNGDDANGYRRQPQAVQSVESAA